MGFGSVRVSHLPHQFRVYISGVLSKSSSLPTTILFCIALHLLFNAHSLRVVLDLLRFCTFLPFHCFIQEILPLNYVCAVLPILTCLLFLFVLPLPGVPLFLLLLLFSIRELDGSCWNTAFPSSEFPFTWFSLPTSSWEISWQVTIKPWWTLFTSSPFWFPVGFGMFVHCSFVSVFYGCLLIVLFVSPAVFPLLAFISPHTRSFHSMSSAFLRHSVANSNRMESTPSDVYPHLWNGLKYFLSLIAMSFSWSTPCYYVFQSIYTCYALYWDLREDWGLLWNFQRGKYFLLRKEVEGRSKHLLPERYYYHMAIVFDVILRWIWLLRLSLVGIGEWGVSCRRELWVTMSYFSLLGRSKWSDAVCGISFEWKTNSWTTVVSSGTCGCGVWAIEQLSTFLFLSLTCSVMFVTNTL